MTTGIIAEVQAVVVAPEELVRGWVSKSLFPAGRDWQGLREEVERNGYRQEHAVAVRPRGATKKGYEIIDGLGRATVAAEKGIARISAVVLEANDQAALRYAVEANLYAGQARTRLSLPQAIVLAKAHEASGGEYRIAPILRACAVSKPTYRRTYSSLMLAIERLRDEHPKLAKRGTAEVVAESVRRNLWPDFTEFYTGKMPANTFRDRYYTKSEKAETERLKQRGYKKTSASRKRTYTQPGESSSPSEAETQPEVTAQPRPLDTCLDLGIIYLTRGKHSCTMLSWSAIPFI